MATPTYDELVGTPKSDIPTYEELTAAKVPSYEELTGPAAQASPDSSTPASSASEEVPFDQYQQPKIEAGKPMGLQETIRRALSPILGPTPSQQVEESVPFGKDAAGNQIYQYKPLGNRIEQQGLMGAGLLDVKPIAAAEGDSGAKSAGKALFNTVAGIENSVMSPGGVMAAGAGAIPGAGRTVAGLFATDMAFHVPSQLEQMVNGKTVQERLEGGLGAVVSLLSAGFAGTHALAGEHPSLQHVIDTTRKELDKVAPSGPLTKEHYPIDPQTLDHLVQTRDAMVNYLRSESPGKSDQVQPMLDHVDDILLKAPNEDVKASEARVRQPAPPTPTAEGEVPPVAEGGPLANGATADSFRQAQEEIAPKPAPEAPPEPAAAQEVASGEGDSSGPGAARASEPFVTETETGIKNAVTEAERDKIGLPEREIPLKRTFGKVWDEARAEFDKNDQVGKELVDGLQKKIRPLTDLEDAVLTHEQADRQADYDRAVDRVNNADTEEERVTAQSQMSKARDALHEVFDIGGKAGTANARGLNARRLMVKEDYSLAKMEFRKKAENGGKTLSEDQLAEVKKAHDRIAELEKQIETSENARKDELSKHYFDQLIKETKQSAQKTAKAGKGLSDFITEQANNARERIKARGFRFTAGLDPVDLVDHAIIGAEYIAKGAKTIAEFSKRMVADFGKAIEPYLDEIFNRAKDFHDSNEKVFTKYEPKSEEKANAKPKTIVAKAKEEAKSGELSHKTVYDLARAHVNAGVQGFGNVMKAVHSDLEPLHKGLTQRYVNDAFSEYGQRKYPSKEADKVKLAEYRRIGQLVSAIEDANAGKVPSKTGLQRNKPTLDVREKMAELKQAIDRAGIETKSPEDQLASRNQARATSLRNSIEELDRRLKTGEKPARGTPVADSPEVEQLRSERDAMKEELNRIEDESNPPTPDHIKELSRLQDRIDKTKDRLARMELDRPPGKATVDTPEIAAARAELKQLSDTISELRKPAPKSAEQKQIEQLAKTRDRLNETLSGERPANAPKDWTPLSAAAEDIKAEIQGMQELAAQLKRDAKPASDPGAKAEQAKIKALEKSIKDYEDRVVKSDFSSKSKPKVTDSAQVAALKSIRDARRDAYEAARDAGKAVRSPDEIRLENYKKSLQRQIDDLQARNAAGNYAPKPKVTTTLDDSAVKLRTARDAERQKFEEGLIKDKLANRTTGAKMADAAVQWSRVAKLASAKVYPKLFEAAVMRAAFEPASRILATPLRLISRGVYEKARPEVGGSVKAAAKYISTGLTSWGKAWEKLRTGRTNIDVHSNAFQKDAEMLNFVGNSHGMMKEPLRQAAFEASKQLRLEDAIKNGQDPNDPITQTAILSDASASANRQVFTGDNPFTRIMVRAPINILKGSNVTGLPALGRTLEFLMPIVNVPTNIAIHTARLNPLIGFSEFAARMANHYRNGELQNGAAKMSNADAELLGRVFKTAALGTVLSAYAWTHPDQFGGLFDEKGRKRDGLKPNEVKMFGVTIPGWMNHVGEMMHINTVASARRVYDRYVQQGTSKVDAAADVLAFATLAPVKHLPFIDTWLRMFSEHQTPGSMVGATLRDAVVPQVATQAASLTDSAERSPKTFTDQLKLPVPGLRETINEKKMGRGGASAHSRSSRR